MACDEILLKALADQGRFLTEVAAPRQSVRVKV
jgi:hypothetical protein